MFSREIQITPISLNPEPGFLETARQSIKLPLAFALGAVLGLATPGFDQDYLVWIGLAPLLVLIRACRSNFQAAFTGFVFGAGYYAIALSFFAGLLPLRWMQVPDFFGYQIVFFSWLLETCHYALLFAAFALMVYLLPTRPGFVPHFRRPFYPYFVVVPAIWIFLMWVVAPSQIFLGMPICQLAYTQAKHLPLIQIAALGGSAAVDCLIVLVNCALAGIFIEITPFVKGMGPRADQLNTKVGTVVDLALALLLVSGFSAWGEYRISRLQESVRPEKSRITTPECPPVPVAIVQGNVSIEEERFRSITPQEFSQRYTDLSAGQGATLVVLPEGVVTVNQSGPGGLKEKLIGIEKGEKKEIIYGAVEPMKEGYANSARILTPFNLPGTTYIKQKLVPFGESIPLNLIYQRIPEELRAKIPASKERFLADEKARLLTSGFGRVGVAICNEIVYPKLVAEEVRKGASLLVCLSNLGWFHNSSLSKQFLACATLRAVENKRFLILSTNTGLSSVIDPTGLVSSRSYMLKRGILLDTVQFIYSKTPYSRMRWL